MSVREYLNNNPAIMTGGAVLLLVVCLGAISCSLFGWGFGGGGASTFQLTYYDLESGTIKLIPASEGGGSPLEGSDQVFRVFIKTCGECGPIKEGMTREELEAGDMFVSHLQTFPLLDRMDLGAMEDNTQVYYMLDEVPTWYYISSPEGNSIMEDIGMHQCEDGSRAKECRP